MKFHKNIHKSVLKGIRSVNLADYKHCHWRTCLMVERCVDQMSFFKGPMSIVIRLRIVLGGAIQLVDIDTVEDLIGNEKSFIKHMNSVGIPLQEVDYNDAKRFFKESIQAVLEGGYNLPEGIDFELVNLMFSHTYPMVVKEIPSAEMCQNVMDLFTVISNDQNLLSGLLLELRDLDSLEMVGLINEKRFEKAMSVILKKKKFVLLSLEFTFYWYLTAKQTKIARWIHNEIIGLKDLVDKGFRESMAVALIINCLCQKARDNMMPFEDLYLGTGVARDFTGQAFLPRTITDKIDVREAKKVCAFCNTLQSKKWEDCTRCNQAIYCCFDHLKNDWKNHSKNCMINSPRLRMMAMVRGASSKSVEEICMGLQDAISSKDYPLAIRILTKAIDKLTIKPLTRNGIKDQLLSFCTKRAYCNLQIALLTKSTQSAQLVIDDYIDFYEAIRGSILDESSEMVQLFESYRDKAYEFIDSQKMLDFLPENIRTISTCRNSPKSRKKGQKIKSQDFGSRYELVECKFMAMHGSLNLECSICRVPYAEFPEPSFAINLVCNHSTCAACLAGLHNVCAQDDMEIPFACPLCRDPINLDKFRYLINSVASKVNSFVFFTSLLPIPGLNNLVGSLLLKYEFDIVRVDSALFNIASLQPLESASRDFSHSTKQEIYDQARKPILALEQEFREIQERLDFIFDHNSVEWKEAMTERGKIIKQLDKARKNASSDIFERMNSSGNLGVLIDADQESDSSAMGHFKVDFHGLHPSEAIKKIDEIILPVLHVMEYVEIVTGKGKHSINGSSILFKSVTDFFKKIPGIEFRIPRGNSGMIIVRYAP